MEEVKNSGEEQKPTIIAEANAAADRMEKANAEKARLLALEQQMIVEKKLSGTTDAGQVQAKPKEESNKEYADRIMRGG